MSDPLPWLNVWLLGGATLAFVAVCFWLDRWCVTPSVRRETSRWTDAEFEGICNAVRAQHEAWAKAHPGHRAWRGHCECGYPAIVADAEDPPACSALRKVMRSR